MDTYSNHATQILQVSGCDDFIKELHGGLSDSFVFQVQYRARTAVLKFQKAPREIRFLTELAPTILHGAEWLPDVLNHGYLDEWNWMVLEHIPNDWPASRRNTDIEALGILKDLHSRTSTLEFDWDDSGWTHDQLNVAKGYLPAETFNTLSHFYSAFLERRTKEIAICSGDPNCPNWLIRDNGQPVLIDWQIVTKANRALDLAGWIANFPTYDEMRKIASIYLDNCGTEPEISRLTTDIAIFFCRRCSLNFWRSEISTKPELWKAGIERTVDALPTWIEKFASACDIRRNN